MIRITVEKIPYGLDIGKELLGEMKIWNKGNSETEDIGNYGFTISKFKHPENIWKEGEIKNFNRKDKGPWDLIYLCLLKAVGGRNADAWNN